MSKSLEIYDYEASFWYIYNHIQVYVNTSTYVCMDVIYMYMHIYIIGLKWMNAGVNWLSDFEPNSPAKCSFSAGNSFYDTQNNLIRNSSDFGVYFEFQYTHPKSK